MPFLLDVEVHVRYLVALPLLIVAELVVHRRLRPLLQQFQERNLVPEAEMPRFDAAVAAAYRLRNSVLAEVLLIAFVYGFGILVVWRQFGALATTTWYATPAVDGYVLSLAGIWYGFVSLPLFQFLICRWYFRLFIWARFLWQVSRIELALVPTHPDRVGGLGFLGSTAYAFAVLAVAHGALLAGLIANRIFFLGASLAQFKVEIGVVVGVRARSSPLSAAGVRLPAGRREAKRAARLRDAGGAIRARVRRQVGARQPAARRAAGRQRRHPVACRPGEQLRGRADDAPFADHEGRHPAPWRRDAGSAGSLAPYRHAARRADQVAVWHSLLACVGDA